MSLLYPSREFDEAVAAVCHGTATEEQMRGLNVLLRADPAARDEYLLRVELHSRLASDPELFAGEDGAAPVVPDAAGSAGGASVSRFPEPACGVGYVGSWRWRRAWRCWRRVGGGIVPPGKRQSRGDEPCGGDAEPRGRRPLGTGWNGPTSGGTVGTGRAPVAQWVGAGGLLQWRARRDRGAGRVPYRFARRSRVSLGSDDGGGSAAGAGLPGACGAHGRHDLGTAFGLVVGGGQTEVHVFQGSVEVQATGRPQKPTAAVRHRGDCSRGGVDADGHGGRSCGSPRCSICKPSRLRRRARLYDRWRSASAWRNQGSLSPRSF
jgi:hypothetical protein